MQDIKVSVAGMVNLLKNLKPKKAAGRDRIKSVVLQELREEFVPMSPNTALCLLYGIQPMSHLHVYSNRDNNQHIIASYVVKHLDS